MQDIKKSINSQILNEKSVFLLDMDGTIYVSNNPIGNMASTLQFLRDNNKQLVFLSNNSSKCIDEYIAKLQNLGLYSSGDIVYSSASASIDYIKKFHNGKKVCLLATDSIKRYFAKCGIEVVDNNADVALLCYDTSLNYQNLCNFIREIKNGAYYIASHPDMTCPAEGMYLPDIGCIIDLINSTINKKPSVIVGKPNAFMSDMIKNRLNLSNNQIIMVGDRLKTDIQFAINSDFDSILVLSGESKQSDIDQLGIHPTYVFNDFNQIAK